MLACLQPHLFVFANFSEYQFDYRKGRSTETALLDVLDRVYYTVADDQQVTAAFDTVDHEILLEHLQTEFGVTGILLSDLALVPPQQQDPVRQDGSASVTVTGLEVGVHQGSVLVSLLFAAFLPSGKCRHTPQHAVSSVR